MVDMGLLLILILFGLIATLMLGNKKQSNYPIVTGKANVSVYLPALSKTNNRPIVIFKVDDSVGNVTIKL